MRFREVSPGAFPPVTLFLLRDPLAGAAGPGGGGASALPPARLPQDPPAGGGQGGEAYPACTGCHAFAFP